MTMSAISGAAESEIQLRRLLRGYFLSLLIVAGLHAALWMLTRKAPVETPVIVPPMVDVELITEPKVASASPSAAPPAPAPRPATPPAKKAEAPPKPKPKPKPPVKPAEKTVPPKESEPVKPVERAEPVRAAPAPPAPSASSAPSSSSSSAAASHGTGAGTGKGSGSGTSDKLTPAHDAAYLHNPKPKYPAVAVARNWEGLVRLRVYVLPNGTAGQVLLHQSSGHDALDEAALDVVQRWRFVPAKRGEQAIASWVVVPLVFKLNSGR